MQRAERQPSRSASAARQQNGLWFGSAVIGAGVGFNDISSVAKRTAERHALFSSLYALRILVVQKAENLLAFSRICFRSCLDSVSCLGCLGD